MAQRIKLGIPTSGGHCLLCREKDFSKRLLFGFDSLEVKMLSDFDPGNGNSEEFRGHGIH